MAINLDNFVQINIKHALNSSFSGSRNVCTLVLFDSGFEEKTYPNYKMGTNADLDDKYSVYFNSFFGNLNGNEESKLKVIIKAEVEPDTYGKRDYTIPFLNILNNELDYTEILVASNLSYEDMKAVREAYVFENQIHEKIFLTYKNVTLNEKIIADDIENFVIKADNNAIYDFCVAEQTTFPTLYEKDNSELASEFNLTEDETFQDGTDYYTKDGDKYILAEVTVGETVPAETYYEKNLKVTADATRVEGKTYYVENNGTYTSYDNSIYELVATGKTPGELVDKDGNQYAVSARATAESGKNYYIITNVGSETTLDDSYKGIEMTIGAYLTQVNVNKYESVKDYCFTKETIEDKDDDNPFKPIDDNKLAKGLMKNYNFIGELVGDIRNLGGNDSAGYSLVNQFMLICLAQELTERVYNLLTQKIKYNTSGLNQISTTLVETLQKYVDNGYLSTDKVWTDNDLYYENNLIMKQNTPLPMGYKVFICPFSSLSKTEYQEHMLPKIYVLVADSYGIRKVHVDGTTF